MVGSRFTRIGMVVALVVLCGAALVTPALGAEPGRIVQWGDTSNSQGTPPAGTGFTTIAAGALYSLALKADGSIVQWGDTSYHEGTPPAGTGFTAIAAGYSHGLALQDVTPPTAVRVPGSIGFPTDPEGDGKYDDVNGNLRKDFADVVLYFNQMTWIAANEPVSLFDFNGNGRTDFADVVWLFNNL